MKLCFYNPEKTYIYPNLHVATPDDIQANYSAVNVTQCVIETDDDEVMFYSVSPFSALKTQHKDIDFTDMSDDEILSAIEFKLNAPAPEPEPSPDERIASAMEYQNLIME